MKNKPLLTFQDASCYGQCSLTVALPILSASGIETSILPASLLSNHTSGFSGFSFLDLSDEAKKIMRHWEREGISFSSFYCGYLGSIKQIENAKEIHSRFISEGVFYLDPAMADCGKLYPGFDEAYVEAMKDLCKRADYLFPNLTEACLLAGLPYQETLDKAFIDKLLRSLHLLGTKAIVLTGISLKENESGCLISKDGKVSFCSNPLIHKKFHGTGDVFASAFIGAKENGLSDEKAARIACDFVAECISSTEESHWYGVRFEPNLGKLISWIRQD